MTHLVKSLVGAAFGMMLFAACAPQPEKVNVTPDNIQLTAPDATANLSAEAMDKNGKVVPNVKLAWSSADEMVAKVDETGKVSAVGSGKASVFAKTEKGLSGECVVTVSLPGKIQLDKETVTLTNEMKADKVMASVLDDKGNPFAGTPAITWSTGDAAVATVDETGAITGVATGTTTVTANFNALSATVSVNVTLTPVDPAAAPVEAPKAP